MSSFGESWPGGASAKPPMSPPLSWGDTGSASVLPKSRSRLAHSMTEDAKQAMRGSSASSPRTTGQASVTPPSLTSPPASPPPYSPDAPDYKSPSRVPCQGIQSESGRRFVEVVPLAELLSVDRRARRLEVSVRPRFLDVPRGAVVLPILAELDLNRSDPRRNALALAVRKVRKRQPAGWHCPTIFQPRRRYRGVPLARPVQMRAPTLHSRAAESARLNAA